MLHSPGGSSVDIRHELGNKLGGPDQPGLCKWRYIYIYIYIIYTTRQEGLFVCWQYAVCSLALEGMRRITSQEQDR